MRLDLLLAILICLAHCGRAQGPDARKFFTPEEWVPAGSLEGAEKCLARYDDTHDFRQLWRAYHAACDSRTEPPTAEWRATKLSILAKIISKSHNAFGKFDSKNYGSDGGIIISVEEDWNHAIMTKIEGGIYSDFQNGVHSDNLADRANEKDQSLDLLTQIILPIPRGADHAVGKRKEGFILGDRPAYPFSEKDQAVDWLTQALERDAAKKAEQQRQENEAQVAIRTVNRVATEGARSYLARYYTGTDRILAAEILRANLSDTLLVDQLLNPQPSSP